MIYIIHKMLVSLKNYLNFLSEDNIFKCFLKEYNNLKKKQKKTATYNDGRFKP